MKDQTTIDSNPQGGTTVADRLEIKRNQADDAFAQAKRDEARLAHEAYGAKLATAKAKKAMDSAREAQEVNNLRTITRIDEDEAARKARREAGTTTVADVITGRFEVTQFFEELTPEDKAHALKAFRYALIQGCTGLNRKWDDVKNL